MRKLILPIIILPLLFGAVISAQDVELPDPGLTPDSPFYFLKTWKESIQTFFTFGAENKAKQFLHLAEVRLAEYQKMIEKGKTEIAEKTLGKYEKQLNYALEKAEETKEKGKDVEKLKETINEKIIKHQEVLERVLDKVPEEAKKGIERAIEASKKGLKETLQGVSGEKKEEPEEPAVKLYKSTNLGFEVQLPPLWQPGLEYATGTLGIGFRREKDMGMARIAFFKGYETPPNQTLEQAAQGLRSAIQANINKKLIQEKFIKVAGEDAWEVITAVQVKIGENMVYGKYHEVFIIHNRRLYDISLAIETYSQIEVNSLFAEIEPDFEIFLKTFKFI